MVPLSSHDRSRVQHAGIVLLACAVLLAGSGTPRALLADTGHASPRASAAAGATRSCALIVTDDDIPSGSATAGALFVRDAAIGRALLTSDVIAVATGFLEAGVHSVVVLDSHDGAIDPAPLKALGVSLSRPSDGARWTWPFLGSDVETASLAALVGYHSRAGQTDGFRAHTINDSIRQLEIDGTVVGEVTHAMMGLGAFGVSTVLVSGDTNAVAEAVACVPAIERVVVRFRGDDGSARFLTSQEAGRRLREAARRAATARIAPYRPSVPLRLALQTHSRLLMRDRSRTLAGKFRSFAANARWDRRRLEEFDFGPTLRVDGRQASWTAPNALAAYVSMSVAASHCCAPDSWAAVTRGRQACAKGDFPAAIACYGEAVRANPYDVGLLVRLADACQRAGNMLRAVSCYRQAFGRLEEICDPGMRSWCLLGLAQTELAGGNRSRALEAARAVLRLPDDSGRHAQARKILGDAGDAAGPRPELRPTVSGAVPAR